MLNSIFIGLTALASITGFSSGTEFAVTTEDYIAIAETINSCITYGEEIEIADVVEYGDIYSIYGENRYLEVEISSLGYLIYDKQENAVVEYNSNSLSPYKDYANDVLKIYHYEQNPYYIVYDNSSFILLNNNLNINFSGFDDLINNSSGTAGQYLTNVVPASNAMFIDNSYYFENLHDCHGLNDSSICTIIATQIAFGYYDTFYNDNLVDETFDVIATEYSNTKITRNFSQSPGTGIKNSDQRFRDYLVNLTTEVIGVSPVNRGMYTTEQIKLVKRYLNDSGISYSLNTSEGNWGDQITNRAKTIIKNTINNNKPVLVNGSGHSTIAYGYDDSYVYVHTGWGYVAATPWATFTTKWFNNEFDTGAVGISITGAHYHSDNYYSAYYDEYYCPDGYSFESLSLRPEDYNFAPQYFFYQKTLDVTKNNYTINTKRLRTGYIEQECINLSSRRQGAGVAYLEYYCPSFVKKITVSISFWSSAELYTPNVDTAVIQYMDSDGDWIVALDLLNDINLSKDRTNQDIISIPFPQGVSNFRFYTTNFALGDRNKGRISIKDLEIMHV